MAWRWSVCGTGGGMKPRFLWQWPSAHLHFLVSCFSFSSWQYPIFSLGFRSGEFAGQSSTPTPWSFNQLLVLLQCGQEQILLENEISIFIKLVSRRKHEVLQNVLVNGCSDVGFLKTQWTNTSRWHCTPNHHRLWKLNTGLQATWLWASPPFLQTLGPWFPNEIQNLLSSEKRTLDHWATVQFFFFLAQVRRLWRQL